MNTRLFTCQQAKQIDLVEYLENLGFKPQNIRNNDYWYHSPFRHENTPSFKVNRKLNVWFDHGIGKGGDIIDFGTKYHQCSISALLQKLTTDFSFHPQISAVPKPANQPSESPIRIISISAINHPSLVNYLTQRCIPLELASRYCKQVEYDLNGKAYTAIGFPNNAGGYELRNQYFKGSVSPKGFSLIENGAKDVAVVEGFFDYLSLLLINQKQAQPLTNYLVLNSLSFFESARAIMEKHASIDLYLDRDPAGIKCTKDALSISSQFVDKSGLYHMHKDVNEWLLKSNQVSKKSQKVKRHH